ncbi:MAG: YvcK family protein [Firmicutes bacterium]|nr:YvcK family protein [Bacillota bacterium]
MSKQNHRGGATKGPRIVVIGGGTGLGTILRGLKEITPNLTAIVAVADDGGSSGRLRRDYGILPPGDIRNCLVAMADLEPLMEKLFQYRFSGDSDLAGHSFGNLFLTAMTGITGDFVAAIKESSKVLAVHGRVLPATLADVTLKAELIDGTIIYGESTISRSKIPIKQVFLEPEGSKPLPEAIAAINNADVIVLGPGSLFTSIIPNLLVAEISKAIKDSKALKLYVCNAMTQPGETANFSAGDHLRAIVNHAGFGLVDIAIVNTDKVPADILARYHAEGSDQVAVDFEKIRNLGVTPLGLKVITKANVIRHDAMKLARIIERLSRTQNIGFGFGKLFLRQLNRFLKGLSV